MKGALTNTDGDNHLARLRSAQQLGRQQSSVSGRFGVGLPRQSQEPVTCSSFPMSHYQIDPGCRVDLDGRDRLGSLKRGRPVVSSVNTVRSGQVCSSRVRDTSVVNHDGRITWDRLKKSPLLLGKANAIQAIVAEIDRFNSLYQMFLNCSLYKTQRRSPISRFYVVAVVYENGTTLFERDANSYTHFLLKNPQDDEFSVKTIKGENAISLIFSNETEISTSTNSGNLSLYYLMQHLNKMMKTILGIRKESPDDIIRKIQRWLGSSEESREFSNFLCNIVDLTRSFGGITTLLSKFQYAAVLLEAAQIVVQPKASSPPLTAGVSLAQVQCDVNTSESPSLTGGGPRKSVQAAVGYERRQSATVEAGDVAEVAKKYTASVLVAAQAVAVAPSVAAVIDALDLVDCGNNCAELGSPVLLHPSSPSRVAVRKGSVQAVVQKDERGQAATIKDSGSGLLSETTRSTLPTSGRLGVQEIDALKTVCIEILVNMLRIQLGEGGIKSENFQCATHYINALRAALSSSTKSGVQLRNKDIEMLKRMMALYVSYLKETFMYILLYCEAYFKHLGVDTFIQMTVEKEQRFSQIFDQRSFSTLQRLDAYYKDVLKLKNEFGVLIQAQGVLCELLDLLIQCGDQMDCELCYNIGSSFGIFLEFKISQISLIHQAVKSIQDAIPQFSRISQKMKRVIDGINTVF